MIMSIKSDKGAAIDRVIFSLPASREYFYISSIKKASLKLSIGFVENILFPSPIASSLRSFILSADFLNKHFGFNFSSPKCQDTNAL